MSQKIAKKILKHWNQSEGHPEFLEIVEGIQAHSPDIDFKNTLRLPAITTIPAMAGILVKVLPEEAISLFTASFREFPTDPQEGHLLKPLLAHIGERLDPIDRKTDAGFFLDRFTMSRPENVDPILPHLIPFLLPPINDGVIACLKFSCFGDHRCSPAELALRMTPLAHRAPKLMLEEFEKAAQSSNHEIQRVAVIALLNASEEDLLTQAGRLINSRKVADRSLAIHMLGVSGKQGTELLLTRLPLEKSAKLQLLLDDTLTELGANFIPITRPKDDSLSSIITFLKDRPKAKLTSSTWFHPDHFPFVLRDGSSLPPQVFQYLIDRSIGILR